MNIKHKVWVKLSLRLGLNSEFKLKLNSNRSYSMLTFR